LDLDFQHRFCLGRRQEILWGLGYRYTTDDLDNTASNSFHPTSRDTQLFNTFIQDEITLIQERLRLTLGSKFEHNDYTGFEVQPNARLLWTPHSRHTLWAAVSRAVRTPSRAEHNAQHLSAAVIPPGTSDNPAPLPVLVSFVGNKDFESEELIAYEIGYRVRAMDNLSLDIAAFYNVYDKLRTGEPGTPIFELSPTPHLLIPFFSFNNMEGETYGIEATVDYTALNWWRLQMAYTFLKMQMNFTGSGSSANVVGDMSGLSPQNQISFRSLMDLPKNLEFDLWVRFVDNLPAIDVDSYLTLDARLAWKARENLELSVVGQNLLDSNRLEFDPELTTLPTEVERGLYGKCTWRF